MPTRDHAPQGSPCWADLWTSDIPGSIKFYGEVFGWEAEEPDPEFGGYFNFICNGVRTAGCMGDMGDMAATDSWKIYLTTDDMTKTVELAQAKGASIVMAGMAVGDLGIQSVLVDPTGAGLGAWEPRAFPGFTVLNEHGTPSWFELHTSNFGLSTAFYHDVFGWDMVTVGDSDEFRYSAMRNPEGEGELAGIMDASAFLPEGTPPSWSVYWEVDSVDDTVAKVKALGGSVVHDTESTPYGRLGAVTDPAGALFKLRTSNS